MTRKAVNNAELEQIVLSHLHANPACKDVRRVRINRTPNPQAKANWAIDKMEVGGADEEACKGELKRLMRELQQHYILQ